MMLDDEAKQLKLQQAKAEARKAIAEADRARFKAALPESSVKPLEGRVDVGEKSGFVAELLAHAVLDRAAGEIVEALPDGARVLVIEDRNLLASDWPYVVVGDQLEHHQWALARAQTALSPQLQEGLQAVGVAAAVPAIVAAGAGLVGLLRTDYALTGRPVTMSSPALVAAVAHRIAARPGNTVAVDGFMLARRSTLLAGFKEACQRQLAVQDAKTDLEETMIVPRQESIKEVVADIDAAGEARLKAIEEGTSTSLIDAELGSLRASRAVLQAELASLKARARKAQTALDEFEKFAASVTAAPDNGYPPLIAAAARECLHLGTDQQVTHVLYVDAGTAGSETITRRSLWATRLMFVGGCQVSYLLLEIATDKTTGGTKSWMAQAPYKLGDNQLGPVVVTPL
ncbi:hypothetical protein [Kitasatospora herbaricolor]|uniref:hypothetical protein n=1 Tax=Kitasatospora herbaricolor TaxID=68217 RepID=UPI0036D7DBE2